MTVPKFATSPATAPQPARIFLLSPAHCGGVRARMLCDERADFSLARRLREPCGAPAGEVFSFLSGLYFRGKLAYALRFASEVDGAWIITPADGLVRIESPLGVDDLARYAAVRVAPTEARYRLPLMRDCARIAHRQGGEYDVVLLGSIATRKYLDVLEPIFAERLRMPREFIGRGDMSRGALMLRAVRTQHELEYVGVADLAAHRGVEAARP